MKKTPFLLLLFIFDSICILTQVNYTAKDNVIAYDGYFRPACNLGSYTSFTSENLAELAAGNKAIGLKGVGVKALRPGIFDEFTTLAGFEDRLPTYDYFEEIGLSEHTLIVGFPHEIHRDTNYYCNTQRSTLFANLYESIWDNGENGTPINDNNYYALYLWQLVTNYKDYIKFWEIWNEPGFDYTGGLGWLPPGANGNWWENNPNPCDYKLRAPIFHYIRLLRISWEIIKTYDPDSYVVVSGTGYPSFLDAILRNTDNPVDGSVNSAYPHGGGAYFDVMGYHAYPHFDGSLQEWNDETQSWDYTRHSDGAAKGLIATKDTFNLVLDKYGFDGTIYPEKLWLITECNLPRKAFGDFIGSNEAQTNFMTKAVVTCMMNDIWQLQIFKLGDDTAFDDAYMEFDLMGLYQPLDKNNSYFQKANDSGVAYKTASDVLYQKHFDVDRTAALALPDNIGGGAFRDSFGNYTYCLWAKTETDQSEIAQAVISFPANLGVEKLIKRTWEYGYNFQSSSISSQNIQLTGTPIFLTERIFSLENTMGCSAFQLHLEADDYEDASLYYWTIEGGTTVNSTIKNPQLTLFMAGEYQITLQVFDADNELLAMQTETVIVEELPTIDFVGTVTGPIVKLKNNSSLNADEFIWDFGDGQSSQEANPTHLYLESGIYEVKLTATNECGSVEKTISLNITVPTTSKIIETANDKVPVYKGAFRPSTNHEFYQGWTDESLADIAAGNLEKVVDGIGVKALRASIGEAFFQGWSYDFKVPTFQHYSNLDLNGNSFILDFPSEGSRDPIFYCPDHQSNLFKDIYLDIWDDGQNETPINDNNPFAVYVYETVNNYKDFVDFWEVLSSPDFDFTGDKAWLPPGEPGNWWENNPNPCDYALRAPIFYYIRQLRISYEIIKSLDPDSYVTVSGIAFPSFLDAIMRNTDNPISGEISTGYPEKGGAYFDAVGFKSYPHFDGSTIYFDTTLGTFAYERHSDAAANGIATVKGKFEAVLDSYGYNGTQFPEKEWIISEANIPRKQIGEFMGSDLAQINWVTKAWIACEKNNIRRLNIHRMAENSDYESANDAFQIMGLFKKITGSTPYNQVPNNEAISLKTTSNILFGTIYDPVKTDDLLLPPEIDGAAFVDGDGQYIYVLWAKTKYDQSEAVSATYSFPSVFEFTNLYKKDWYYGLSNTIDTISANNVVLSGTPIFLTEVETTTQAPVANFSSTSNKFCTGEEITLIDASINEPNAWFWSFPEGTPTTSTAKNPTVVYQEPGIYPVSLTVQNANGSHTKLSESFLEVVGQPEANFEIEISSNTITVNNQTKFAETYFWLYGDGSTDAALNPVHTYFQNGFYEVTLIAENQCGTDTLKQEILIGAAPTANFNIQQTGTCGEYSIILIDASSASPTDWNWFIPEGNPSIATSQFPTIHFDAPGLYQVSLEVSNEFGTSEVLQTVYVEGNISIDDYSTICEGDEFNGIAIFSDTIIIENLTTQNLACDSIIKHLIDVEATIETEEWIDLCEGELYDGQNIFSDTTILELNSSYTGCDSLVSKNIQINPVFNVELTDTILIGEVYSIGGNEFTSAGEYEISLSTVLGCDSIIFLNLFVNDPTNTIILREDNFNLKVFPNPFDASFIVDFLMEKQEHISISIVSMEGKVLFNVIDNKLLAGGQHEISVSAENLMAGMYFLQISIDGNRVNRFKKIVKL